MNQFDITYTLPDFPKRVVVELTNTCNMNCDYCPRRHLKMKKGAMNADLFKSIIDQCAEHSCDVVPFWRGELFLHKDINKLLTYAVYSVPNVYIATNGSRWSTYTIPRNTLDKLTSISVSLHSMYATRVLYHLNDQREFERPHLQVSAVENTPSEYLLNNLSFDYLRLTDTKRVYKQHSKNGKWGQLDNHIDEPNRHSLCSRLLTDLVIAWDGSISECCYVWPTLKGNQNNAKHRSLEELWKWSDLRKIRDEYPNGYCLDCDQWRGGGKSL